MTFHHIGVLPTSLLTWKILCNEKDNPRPFVSFSWVGNHLGANQLVRVTLCPKCETLWRAWERGSSALQQARASETRESQADKAGQV